MTEQVTLTDKLRPFVRALEAAHTGGDKLATDVIRLYEMHRRSPSDPGALGLCSATFDEWLKKNPDS